MAGEYTKLLERREKDLEAKLSQTIVLLQAWLQTADVAKDMTFAPIAKLTEKFLNPEDEPMCCCPTAGYNEFCPRHGTRKL